jgi:hypothetical protein
MSKFVARTGIALVAAVALSGTAFAQGWTPASEIMGQPIQVTTNGVTDTIYLDSGGTARFMTPGGNTVAGSWTAANGQLCLSNGAAQECFPYTSPFQAGQPVTLTSSCNATSTWLASAVNGPPPASGAERGRR